MWPVSWLELWDVWREEPDRVETTKKQTLENKGSKSCKIWVLKKLQGHSTTETILSTETTKADDILLYAELFKVTK